MNSFTDKTQENKSHSAANAVSKKQTNSKTTFQLVDNRPEAVAQRKLKEIVSKSANVAIVQRGKIRTGGQTLTQRYNALNAKGGNAEFMQVLFGIKEKLKMLKTGNIPMGKNQDQVRAGIDNELSSLENLTQTTDRSFGQA